MCKLKKKYNEDRNNASINNGMYTCIYLMNSSVLGNALNN